MTKVFYYKVFWGVHGLSLSEESGLATIEQFRCHAIESGVYADLIAEGDCSVALLDGCLGVCTNRTFFVQGGEGESICLLSAPVDRKQSAHEQRAAKFNARSGMSPLFNWLNLGIEILIDQMESDRGVFFVEGLQASLIHACDPLNCQNRAEEFRRVLLVLYSFSSALHSGGVSMMNGSDSQKILAFCNADLPTNL